MRFAIIGGDTVINIALASGPMADNWICIEGLDPIPGIGWKYIDGVFSEAV